MNPIILATHMGVLAFDITPVALYSDQQSIKVTFRPRMADRPNELDLVYFNGRCVGNRHGAMQEYAKLVLGGTE